MICLKQKSVMSYRRHSINPDYRTYHIDYWNCKKKLVNKWLNLNKLSWNRYDQGTLRVTSHWNFIHNMSAMVVCCVFSSKTIMIGAPYLCGMCVCAYLFDLTLKHIQIRHAFGLCLIVYYSKFELLKKEFNINEIKLTNWNVFVCIDYFIFECVKENYYINANADATKYIAENLPFGDSMIDFHFQK